MGKIGQARGFLFFRIVNKFFFRKRKKNKNGIATRTFIARVRIICKFEEIDLLYQSTEKYEEQTGIIACWTKINMFPNSILQKNAIKLPYFAYLMLNPA